MADSTFTFRVDEDLKSAFAEAAKAQDRTAAQLLRTLMRQAVEHDAWFRAEVEKGLREADDPKTKWIPHEEVVAKRRRWRAETLKRAGVDAAARPRVKKAKRA